MVDLQFGGWKPLNAHAVEEPGRVGRHVRGLIGPVVKLVKREQTDIGEENTSVHVEAMLDVEVVACVGLAYITIGVGEIPLSSCGAGVVARRGRGVKADLC